MTVGSHLSTEVVSDLLEGLLSEQDRVAAEEHLASCAQCTEVAEALVGVRDVLRSAPPPPMPENFAERITAALAVESASRADETGVVSLGQARQRKFPRRASQILLAAASVAVLAIGGGLVVNSVTKDQPYANINPSTSTPTKPVISVAANKLYLTRGGSANLTSAGFADEAAKLLTTEEPMGSKGIDPPQNAVNPLPCLRAAVGGEDVRDHRSVSYDGQRADLVISNPRGTDIIRAYVITGCPSEGTVVKKADLPH
jgi:Putative zinc-finger